jgi:putative glutamine amidotransferase
MSSLVRVGITAHIDTVLMENGEPLLHYVAAAPYVKAVRLAGGFPVLLPVVEPGDAAEVLRMVDALIVTGGCDVDPANYGAAAEPLLGAIDALRDDADLAIVRAAVAANTPTLAICRGVQVLNVAMNGTLVQHVDEHMRLDLYNEDVHTIDIDPASRLATIVGGSTIGVNSLHHQVVDRLGDGVRAVAHNHDGHVEAIEIEHAPAVLGVQWHPELMRHRGDHLILFEDLLRQAQACMRQTPRI